MEPTRTSPERTILKVAASLFLLIYLAVGAVAFVTSAVPFGGGASGWYAAVAPVAYAGICALWAFGALSRLSRPFLWILHLLAVPALVFSLLGLGLLLPLLAILWWAAAGKPAFLGGSASPA
jgi:hypothetical protein